MIFSRIKLNEESSPTKFVIFSLFLVVLAMISSSGAVHAAYEDSVIYVNGSSGDNNNDGYSWDTAKKTIGNATGTIRAGGTVTIASGTYTGTGNVNLTIDKDMIITGNSKTNTGISGGYNQIFIITSDTTVTIANLTLVRGEAKNGGAIYNEGNLTIKNCNIMLNTAECGGGIYNADGGTCTVTGSSINRNTANIGGGIYNSGTCNVTGSLTNSNTATDGGGIFNEGTCNVTCSNINGNTATDSSGGILNNGICNVTGSNIKNNIAKNSGGGIYNQGNCTVTNSTINSNTATDYSGGGIYNEDKFTCTVINSNINGNTATGNGGGIFNSGTFSVTDSNINGNTTTSNGGGIGIICCGTCTLTNSNINGNTATGNGGGIYNGSCGPVTVTNSNINGNTAHSGGGISNYYGNLIVIGSSINGNFNVTWGGGINNLGGTCTVTDSSINGNTAYCGGGIYNQEGTCTVTDSSINGNTAYAAGGGIDNNSNGICYVTNSNINNNTATVEGGAGGGIDNNSNGICYVTNSNIKGNTANIGGGIYNLGNCTVTGCNFEFNKANDEGNAIYNRDGDGIINFNRFNDPSSGYEIYCESGSLDAMYNWWGSNEDPSSKVYGNVETNPWLLLTLKANPTITYKESTITADITQDSNGKTYELDTGLNGIIINFSTTLGTITSSASTVNGVASVILTDINTAGVADIYALLDNEIANTSVISDMTPPTITSSVPANGVTNIDPGTTITLNFSEAIQIGTNWIELLNSSKTAIPFTMSINGNILTITPTISLAEDRYKLSLHTGCVRDLAGNPLAGKSINFSVGTSPTITGTDPYNDENYVKTNKTITVTFNEVIRKSANFWVELVDSTGNAVAYTSYITGSNILVIDPTSNLATNTTYKVKLHTGCLTDTAGNPLTAKTIIFTTRNT